MNRRDLHIAEPCHASWEAMTGDDARRFCGSCEKHVHHLSGMTRREAERLMSAPREGGNLCVRYAFDAAGDVRFRVRKHRATAPRHQRRGAAELVATASAVAALLGACAWPSAFAQDHMMGEPPMQVGADGLVQGQEMMPMGQVPATVHPDADPDATEPCDGSGDGAWGPIDDPMPLMGDVMADPWDDDLGEQEPGDDGAALDVDHLQPTMGRLPLVPTEALYGQEQQAAQTLGELGLTLEEEEIVDDSDDDAPDATIVIERPEIDGDWIQAQGGMPAPMDMRR